MNSRDPLHTLRQSLDWPALVLSLGWQCGFICAAWVVESKATGSNGHFAAHIEPMRGQELKGKPEGRQRGCQPNGAAVSGEHAGMEGALLAHSFPDGRDPEAGSRTRSCRTAVRWATRCDDALAYVSDLLDAESQSCRKRHRKMVARGRLVLEPSGGPSQPAARHTLTRTVRSEVAGRHVRRRHAFARA